MTHRSSLSASVSLSVALATLALAACGSHGAGGGDSDAGSGGPPFIAFATDFAPFRTWPSFHSDGPPDDGTFPAGVLGPRTQYINALPPHGSTEFPKGTMIVEVRENGTGKIFAAAKRGLPYNTAGAQGWEWFELTEMPGTSTPVNFVWRGFGPPVGDTYGGDDTCNKCHVACGSTTDYVCSAQLQLPNF